MISSRTLKEIVAEARPIIERQLDDAARIAAFREVVTAQGGDWSSLKALIKAQVQDEADDGKRVQKILDKADFATGYADMLGWSNMNENNFSADAEDGEAAQSDGGAISEVKGKVRPENAAGVEPPSSDTNPAIALLRDAAGQTVDAITPPVASTVAQSEPYEPPAFLRKTVADFRPHCQHPDACAASTLKHCNACQKAVDAVRESEAA